MTTPTSSSPETVVQSETPDTHNILSWREHFKTPSRMQRRQQGFLIENFLPFGTVFLGGPSGHGKTWVALSMAKALYYGRPFLGFFPVPVRTPIIYLTPEVGESSFKSRLNLMGLGDIDDDFICQTLSDGPPVSLRDPYLMAAVEELKPVVFLDTAVRFNPSDDENDAMQSAKGLGSMMFGLLQNGARAVVCLHHSPKLLAQDMKLLPSLENTLRGTGDLGAISDTVWCVRSTDLKNFRATITNVKPRDFDAPEPFEIQGRPYLSTEHDLRLIRPPNVGDDVLEAQEAAIVARAIVDNPKASIRELANICKINKNRITHLANLGGWVQPFVSVGKGSPWQRKPEKIVSF